MFTYNFELEGILWEERVGNALGSADGDCAGCVEGLGQAPRGL